MIGIRDVKKFLLTFFPIGVLAAFLHIHVNAGEEPDMTDGKKGKENATVSTLSSMAMRVHNTDAMVAFYTEAFGVQFREVDTQGFTSWFGELDGVTFKLVPIRESADFEDYPSHQPGFRVDDVEKVIALAIQHGGRQEGQIIRGNGKVHGAVRDPDGNTIELYASE